MLNWIGQRYGPSVQLVVTENGMDVVGENDKPLSEALHDADRVAYLSSYIDAMGDSISDGYNVDGLLRVVAHGQLRVGGRVQPSLRHPLRRLQQQPGTLPEGQCTLVRAAHRQHDRQSAPTSERAAAAEWGVEAASSVDMQKVRRGRKSEKVQEL